MSTLTRDTRCGSVAVVRECGITNTVDLSSVVSLKRKYYGGRARDDARRGIAPEVFQATSDERVLNVYRVSRAIDSLDS